MSLQRSVPLPPSPRLRNLAPCPHGSITDSELQALGLNHSAVIDFSASTNPLGPSPTVRQALAAVDIRRYPDDDAVALRQKMSDLLKLDISCLLVGNGSSELIWLLALAYLDPGDRVLVIGPTYGEYARAARMLGAAVIDWRAEADADFRPDVPALCTLIQRKDPKLVFLCNPNNPTGVLLGRREIEHVLVAMRGLLVLDEAYIGFVTEPPALLDLVAGNQLVVLRSLTKDHALTGLRLGYAAAAPAVIEAMRKVRPPWSVNATAQVAGVAALGDSAHLECSVAAVGEAKAYFLAELARFGCRVVAPSANFLLVEVGDGRLLRQRLLRHGCVVRDCASFGLPAHVRIGVRTLPECRRLVAALEAVLTETSGGRL